MINQNIKLLMSVVTGHSFGVRITQKLSFREYDEEEEIPIPVSYKYFAKMKIELRRPLELVAKVQCTRYILSTASLLLKLVVI